MISRLVSIVLLASATLFFTACKDMPAKKHGPITLGDSSTIVTEKDPQKLLDLVTELQPEIPEKTEVKDTPASQKKPVVDTPKKGKTATAVTPPAPVVTGPGLSAEFTEVTVFIQNLNAKIAGKPNLQKANGAVYTLNSGNINGSIIKVSGNVTKVSQRYQSVIVYKNGQTSLPLESLSTTTAWAPLTGGNNLYRITGLDAASMDYSEANNNALRNALSKAAQKKHINKKKIQELLNSIKHVKASNQKPFVIVLRSVMWKIDGKDAQGKIYSKQIRVDIPL